MAKEKSGYPGGGSGVQYYGEDGYEVILLDRPAGVSGVSPSIVPRAQCHPEPCAAGRLLKVVLQQNDRPMNL